jgi:hypothetical protein
MAIRRGEKGLQQHHVRQHQRVALAEEHDCRGDLGRDVLG